MKAIDYREYPEKLRGELFPPVPLPELPSWPPADVSLEQFFAELDKSRDGLDAAEERVRTSEREIADLESRGCPARLQEIVDQNQVEMRSYERWAKRHRSRTPHVARMNEMTKVVADIQARSVAQVDSSPPRGSWAASLAVFLFVGVPLLLVFMPPFARSPGALVVCVLLSMSAGILVLIWAFRRMPPR